MGAKSEDMMPGSLASGVGVLFVMILVCLASCTKRSDLSAVYLRQCRRLNKAARITASGKPPARKEEILRRQEDCQKSVELFHATCVDAMEQGVSISGGPKIAFYIECVASSSAKSK